MLSAGDWGGIIIFVGLLMRLRIWLTYRRPSGRWGPGNERLLDNLTSFANILMGIGLIVVLFRICSNVIFYNNLFAPNQVKVTDTGFVCQFCAKPANKSKAPRMVL